MRIEGREAAMEHIRKLAQIRAECEGEPMTSEEQRRAWREDEKAKIGAMLARAESYGRGAFRTAVQLLDSGMSYGDILAAARKTPAGPPSDSVHRAGVIRGDASLGEREETPEDEADWLREARLAAEKAWASLNPQRKVDASQLRSLKPSEIAFHRMSAGLAHDAASMRYHDGQQRFQGDHLDEALRRQGEAAGRRLWPGR